MKFSSLRVLLKLDDVSYPTFESLNVGEECERYVITAGDVDEWSADDSF